MYQIILFNSLELNFNESSSLNFKNKKSQSGIPLFGKAYVITTKKALPLELINSTSQCGFKPVHVAAVQPRKDQFHDRLQYCASCLNISVDSPSAHHLSNSYLTLAEIGLVCSTQLVMHMIANDPLTTETDWSLILEDDARLHPYVSDARTVIRNAFRASLLRGYDFVYLGICGGACGGFNVDRSIGYYCTGACTHAYAVTKRRAQSFFKEVYSERSIASCSEQKEVSSAGCDLDAVYYSAFKPSYSSHKKGGWVMYFKETLYSLLLEVRVLLRYVYVEVSPPPLQQGKPFVAHVAGWKFVSPDDNTHRGLFYQCCRPKDQNFGSNLRSQNSFIP